ncbi:MAG: hypothetical protein AAF196_00705 [Planctomycetota bacterium]
MAFENRYSLFDRWFHRLAFATTRAQVGLADLEEKLFKKELRAFQSKPPLFVTALPRAGTTILLEVAYGLPTYATHTYRDMPLVLCPLLRAKLAGKPGAADTPVERAHGDGIAITQDSPEAFEEMMWMRFFKRHYPEVGNPPLIEPWSKIDDPEFLRFFARHRHSIVALRRRQKPGAVRYISKNNQNIARLGALLDATKGAAALIPVREPLQHANSLLRQHLRFREMHREDPFARRYMRGIGHFDFGENLRPIAFDGVRELLERHRPDELQFWLGYWVCAYRELAKLEGQSRVTFVKFEQLDRPKVQERLRVVFDAGEAEFRESAARLSVPPSKDVPTDRLERGTLEEARSLYERLGG